MARVDLTVAAGQTVSSAGYLFPVARTWAVYASSHATGSAIRVAFGTSSGANFGVLQKADGSGVAYTVASTNLAAWGTLTPPTPFVRLDIVGAPASEARSFFMVPVS
jgi:hypothetical protein